MKQYKHSEATHRRLLVAGKRAAERSRLQGCHGAVKIDVAALHSLLCSCKCLPEHSAEALTLTGLCEAGGILSLERQSKAPRAASGTRRTPVAARVNLPGHPPRSLASDGGRRSAPALTGAALDHVREWLQPNRSSITHTSTSCGLELILPIRGSSSVERRVGVICGVGAHGKGGYGGMGWGSVFGLDVLFAL